MADAGPMKLVGAPTTVVSTGGTDKSGVSSVLANKLVGVGDLAVVATDNRDVKCPEVGDGPSPVTLKYKMRGIDSGAAPPGYVTWISEGAPDFAGVGYSGGSPPPISTLVPGSVVQIDEFM